MLTRLIVSASLAVFVATQAPTMLASQKDAELMARHEAAASSPYVVHGKSENTTLTVGADGHFSGPFLANGHLLTGIVDTGATFVALSEAVAREIGVRPDKMDFDHTVATAGGDVRAARVKLSSLTVGHVSLTDVDALVIAGDAMPAILIGMSFLGRLSSYAVAGGTMDLIQ